jgi:hypothetical protein
MNPTEKLPSHGPKVCHQGSVSKYYVSPPESAAIAQLSPTLIGYPPQIDVQTPSDVIVAFEFARNTGARIVIKNTGHDYKGRSHAPDSLTLWVRAFTSLNDWMVRLPGTRRGICST